jgi:IrrE N-terminal-like domain
MAPDASTGESIRQYAKGALIRADAVNAVPVPIDQVAQVLRFAAPTALSDLGGVPPGLLARIAGLRGKVLGALDFREHVIYLDRNQPTERQRFHLGHELGHDVLPWHRDAYYGDDRFTLDPDTRDQLEAEASSFAVELLTGADGFERQAAQYRTGLGAPLELAEAWELSRTVVIRRYVETHRSPCGLVYIGRYPGNGRVKVLNAYESPAFRAKYGQLRGLIPPWLEVDRTELGAAAHHLITTGGDEPIVSGKFALEGRVAFEFELTWNTYKAFALLFERSRLPMGRRIRPVWTGPLASTS